jgi:dTMP kinase
MSDGGILAGVFITVEGIEGSGKSTQIQRLVNRLTALDVSVAVSKEPGGTALCQDLRKLILTPHPSGERWCPKSELLLFYADRAQHVTRFLEPALEAGHVVVMDRFDDSTRAYQGAAGISETVIERLADIVLGRIKPQLTLLLDLDPEAALERVASRNASLGKAFKETRFDDEALEFHRRVRSRFLAMAQKEPQRIALVPAQDSTDSVADAIWARVAPLMRIAGRRVE